MQETVPLTGQEAEAAWEAFSRRDRQKDGAFVVAVSSTGIYCKASCPARRPARQNVLFFATGEEAVQSGFRPCLRCRPDDVGRDRVAVRRAVERLEQADAPVLLEQLAQEVGYAPHHFQRLFVREVGVSPAAYGRQLRSRRLEQALTTGGRVTDAIYDAGFGGAAAAYDDSKQRLGMSPGTRRRGGAGEHLRFAITPTSLGQMLVAATEKGLARISFDEGESDLRRHFPNAEIIEADDAFRTLVQDVAALVDDPARIGAVDLPMDVRGTAFQESVWQALRAIPPGETRTYSQLAAAVGRPNAVRATGTACGDNRLAILIPCHRILRSDGGLGGYAYGLERKRALLRREGKDIAD